MLPDTDGFELFGPLRQHWRTPIIMLTARGERADKLRGLSLGADDYITKPFDLEEFLARVRNVLRRVRPAVERLALGGVTVDFGRDRDRNPLGLHLTEQEFVILQYWQNTGTASSIGMSFCGVWGIPKRP
jgi:two-component system phosphate regulon response regulator PhoB